MTNLNLEAQKQKEITSLKKLGKIIGFSLILMLIFAALSDVLLTFVFSRLNLDTSISNSYLSTIYNYISSAITTILYLLLPGLIILSLSKQSFKSVISFNKINKGIFISIIALGMLTSAFANNVALQAIDIYKLIGINFNLPTTLEPYSNHILSIIVAILYVAVCPALFEEFLFRGVILGSLRKYGDSFAIITSATLFALIHVNIPQILFAFLYALILGFIVVKTDSILPVVIIHFLNNLFSTILEVIKQNFGQLSYDISSKVFYIIFFIIGMIGLVYILKKDKLYFNVALNKSTLTSNECYKYFYLNLFMIVFLIFILISIISENYTCFSGVSQ